MANLKLAGCVLLMCMVVCAPSVQAVTCGDVTSSMAPCISYLTSGGPVPSGCCNGLKSLNNAAKTTPDRQTVCRCLVSAAGSIPGLQPNLVSGLPASCGLNLPYQFSTSTNCNGIK